MAESLLSSLDRLRSAISDMAARNVALTARNKELERENVILKEQAEQAEAARKRTEKDVEYLTMSHRLAENPDNIIETRRHISKLIRNIDRCLEMLKE